MKTNYEKLYYALQNTCNHLQEENAKLRERLKRAESERDELQDELDKTTLSFTKVMEFVVWESEPDFIRCWLEGDWDGCREWQDDYDLHPAIFYPEEKMLKEIGE